jgi:Domain of unknown function (DUF4145)
MNLNFTCPYCGQPTTITEPNRYTNWDRIRIEQSKKGEVGIVVTAITCPNPKCQNLFLKVSLNKAVYDHGSWNVGTKITSWQLLPESEAKVMPDYIPTSIKDDYYESCRIRNLSPKASATLSRRCLQGMIRDYWGISKNQLKDEIDALEDKLDKSTWEAQLLIGLIETLVDDWYVARNNRQERLEKIKQMAEVKKTQKKSIKNTNN